MENKVNASSIDDYIAGFPESVQNKLQELRAAIKVAAPDAEEKISYQMPAFAQKGILVYFAAHKNHIGFYPTSSGIEKFKEELSTYEISKGAIRFPLDKSIPYELVKKIVSFRLQENLNKGKNQKKADRE